MTYDLPQGDLTPETAPLSFPVEFEGRSPSPLSELLSYIFSSIELIRI
jgi:hypothetical protein